MSYDFTIVMAYHDRLSQLKNTLYSIEKSSYAKRTKIVIVDDASSPEHTPNNLTKNLNIQVISVPKESKTWVNPCIAYNIGFTQIESDIVIIQNPECYHCGDVLNYVKENLTQENYLSFSCRNLKEPIKHNIDPRQLKGNWYNHPNKGRQTAYHFLSAITRENLEKLNGFDERYGPGYCFDDDEFLVRIKRMGLNVQIVPDDTVYCAHQFHDKTILGGEIWQRNRRLFEEVTLKETGYRANG